VIYEKVQALLLLLLLKQCSISIAVMRHALSPFATDQLGGGVALKGILSEVSNPFHVPLLLIDIVIEYTIFLDLIESKF